MRPVLDHDKIELDIWWNIYHTHNKILKIGTNIPHFIISRIRSWSSCQILLGIGSEKKGMPYYGAQIYVNGRLLTRYFPHLTWRGGAQTGFVIGGKIGWARLATYSIPGHHHLPPTWWPRWPPLVIKWPWLVRQKLWVGWECCTSCSSSPPWPSPPSCPSTWWGSTSWRPARASTTSCTRLGSAGSQGRSVSVKPESYHSSALPLYWVMFLRLDWCNPGKQATTELLTLWMIFMLVFLTSLTPVFWHLGICNSLHFALVVSDRLRALSKGHHQEPGRKHGGNRHIVHVQVELHRVWARSAFRRDDCWWDQRGDNCNPHRRHSYKRTGIVL